MILAEGNVCLRSGLQEWKSTPVGHAGLWVIQPYKGIIEAEDRRTSPAHAHISLFVCACVHLWWWGGGGGAMGW